MSVAGELVLGVLAWIRSAGVVALAGLAVVPSELAESGAETGAPKGEVSKAVFAAANATALYRAYTAIFWNKSQTLGWM